MIPTLEIEDYYKFNHIKALDISSTGDRIVYTRVLYKENDIDGEFHQKEVTNLWVLDHRNNEHRQLTFGHSEFNPSLSPDGTRVIYAAKRDEKPQLYLLDFAGGESKQLTSLQNGAASQVVWLSSSRIVFTAARDTKPRDPKLPYRVQRPFFRMDALGYVQDIIQDIYTLDLHTEELTCLTENDFSHIQVLLSPDKTKLLVHSMFLPEEVMGIYPKLHLFDFESKEVRQLTHHYVTQSAWVSDTKIVFVGSDPDAIIGTKSDLYHLDIMTNEVRNVTSDDLYGVSGGLQADMPTFEARMPKLIVQDNMVYANVQVGGNIEIRKIDLSTGSITTVIGGDQANYLREVVGDNIFYVSSDLNRPLDIYVHNTVSGTSTALTQLNAELLSSKQLPTIRHLKFNGADGVEVEGWIMLPQGTGPFPTLLNIHGGPHAGWGNIFQWEAHYLCGAGYAVLMVNHRGSTGYGSAFSTRIIGDWGNHDYLDLMAGVDYAIDLELADMNKLGCFGISGGGNLSSWIVGQTRRFKAAIPENPVTNWNSFYGTSDIGRWFARKEMNGLPWEIPEIYRKSSPLTYAHTCTTPTLMIQHENDLRCPAEQSDQFYNVLKEVGCVVEMLRMPETPHGGSGIGPLPIREGQNKAILEWFNRHLR
ncbi:MAG: prolyl oligopeptidase family serine peptidase [Candidatus Kariarchaeaceae archaeon]|jgi:dipeptidyl aminopeptidase/acylaminoacyl peptidase